MVMMFDSCYAREVKRSCYWWFWTTQVMSVPANILCFLKIRVAELGVGQRLISNRYTITYSNGTDDGFLYNR